MSRRVAAVALLLFAFCDSHLFGKAPTSKVTIISPDGKSVDITDSNRLKNFSIWAGPNTSSNDPESLIMDWARGSVEAPRHGLRRYRIDFYAKLPNERRMYVVWYEYDPLSHQGYVYLPGRGEEWYDLDVGTIIHGTEGKWFYASTTWNGLARSLLKEVSKEDPAI